MLPPRDSGCRHSKRAAVQPRFSPQSLCLECGMCCDGTVFADVRLSAEDIARIGTGRLPACFQDAPLRAKLRQPCPALIKGECAIYRTRPDHCRNFDCRLLQRAVAGEVSAERALKIIRSCRKKADNVRRLLQTLGDTNEQVAVMTRFRRMLRRCESRGRDPRCTQLLAKLTLAAHHLTRALSRHIYP